MIKLNLTNKVSSKFFTSFILLWLVSLSAYSKIKISGVVKDSIGPVEFANVVLFDKEGVIIKGAVTNEKGYFEILHDKGQYKLSIGFVGYETWNEDITITKDIDFGNIYLKWGTELDEVIIKSRDKIFEKKIDRLVFNVKNLPSVQGGDLLDVINVTPRVKFQNDQILMIGKDNLKLMINGRVTNVSGSSMIALLNSISADDIEKVEIITTPPAKFSAEGNSGLINIVYKKGRRNSWSSTIRSTYIQATYDREITGVNFDYNKNKLTFKSSVNLVTGSRLITDSNTIFYSDQQWNAVSPRRIFYKPILSGSVVLDYQFSKNFLVGLQYIGNDNELQISKKENTGIINNATRELDSIITTPSFSSSKSATSALNLYSEYKLDSLGKKVNFLLDYFSFDNSKNGEYESRNFSSDGEFLEGSYNAGNNIGIQKIKNYSLGIDVELPLKNIDIDFGGRIAITKTNNDNTFFNLSTGIPILDTNLTNEFEFEENTQAIYISANKQFNKKWEAKIGIRLENTQTIGFSLQQNQENRNDYLRLFPSAYLSHDINENHNLSFSVSSRISRPTFEFLNPFRIVQNQYSFTEGNPELQPSFSDNIEFSHTYRGKLTSSIYYSKRSNVFAQVTLTNEQTNIQQTIPLNYFDRQTIGLSESYSFSPFDWWECYSSLELYYAKSNSFRNNLDVNKWETSGYFELDNSWKLDKKGVAKLNTAFWIQFPSSGELFSTKQYSNLDIGVNFSMLSNQLRLSVTGTDLFRSQRPQYKEISNNIEVEYNVYRDDRALKVSLSYKFGNSKIRIRSRRTGNEAEKRRTSN